MESMTAVSSSNPLTDILLSSVAQSQQLYSPFNSSTSLGFGPSAATAMAPGFLPYFYPGLTNFYSGIDVSYLSQPPRAVINNGEHNITAVNINIFLLPTITEPVGLKISWIVRTERDGPLLVEFDDSRNVLLKATALPLGRSLTVSGRGMSDGDSIASR